MRPTSIDKVGEIIISHQPNIWICFQILSSLLKQMFAIFYFCNTSLLMTLTSGTRSYQVSSRLKFYSIPLLERESQLLGFIFHFLGTQLAWVILCRFQSNNYSQQWSTLLLGGCWKRRQNVLPTKWQILSSFLGYKKVTFGSVERTRVSLPIALHRLRPADSNSPWPPMSQASICTGWNFLLSPLMYSFPFQSKGH